MTAREQLTSHVLLTQARKISLRRRLADLVILIRLPSCLAGGASVLLGVHLTAEKTWPAVEEAWPGMLSMFFAVAAANAVNDVLDIRADAIGKPSRPLPDGRLTVRSAIMITAAAALAATASAAVLGIYAMLWAVVLLALAFFYSFRVKNTVLAGNAIVAACASSPILFGSVICSGPTFLAAIGTGLSFTFMLAYETLKTVADHDSDAVSGIHTFAAKFGVRAAVLLLRSIIALLTAAVCAASAVSSHPFIYLLAAVITFMFPAWSGIVLLGSHPDVKAVRVSVFFMRSAWFLGIIALWLLR